MKLLRLKLANTLTKGDYMDACKSAVHWEEQCRLMQDKAVKLERALKIAERALIEKDGTISDLHEGLDRIVRHGEGKIGPKGNGSLRRVVRMAEEMLYPNPEVKTDETDKQRRRNLLNNRDLAQTALLEDTISQSQRWWVMTAGALAATCSSDTSGSSSDSSSAGGEC